MTQYIGAYIGALLTLGFLDALWLGVIARNFYKMQIGHLFRDDLVWWSVVLFYVLYAGAIVYFAVLPSDGSFLRACGIGAFLGFTAYMTYDLVNYATLKGWTLPTVFADIAWGMCITAIAACISVWIMKFAA